EDDGDPMAQEPRERVIGDGDVLTAELLVERSGPEVAGWTDFKRDAPVGEEVHQGLVVHRGNAVADAFHAEKFDGFSDFLRTAVFGVRVGGWKARSGCGVVGGGEGGGWHAKLVTADAESDDFP